MDSSVAYNKSVPVHWKCLHFRTLKQINIQLLTFMAVIIWKIVLQCRFR